LDIEKFSSVVAVEIYTTKYCFSSSLFFVSFKLTVSKKRDLSAGYFLFLQELTNNCDLYPHERFALPGNLIIKLNILNEANGTENLF